MAPRVCRARGPTRSLTANTPDKERTQKKKTGIHILGYSTHSALVPLHGSAPASSRGHTHAEAGWASWRRPCLAAQVIASMVVPTPIRSQTWRTRRRTVRSLTPSSRAVASRVLRLRVRPVPGLPVGKYRSSTRGLGQCCVRHRSFPRVGSLLPGGRAARDAHVYGNGGTLPPALRPERVRKAAKLGGKFGDQLTSAPYDLAIQQTEYDIPVAFS